MPSWQLKTSCLVPKTSQNITQQSSAARSFSDTTTEKTTPSHKTEGLARGKYGQYQPP